MSGEERLASLNPPPPPVPERPNHQSRVPPSLGYNGGAYGGSSYGHAAYPMQSSYGYGGGYPSYGSSFGSSYGSYGSYRGGLGGGYGDPYGGASSSSSSPSGGPLFVRLAEENTRPAFETIQSVVHSFNSVSMMFESTFFALHSSFRAMLSVVEHMSRAKAQLSHVLSAFTAIRLIKWAYRKLAGMLGMALPVEATTTLEGPPIEELQSSVNWPILLYTALTVAAPYLMWKLVSSFAVPENMTEEDKDKNLSWMSGKEEHFVARAEFDFRGERSEEVSFQAGQEIIIAPKHRQPRIRGWLLGTVDGSKAGLVPANYVKLIGRKEAVKPDLVADSMNGALEEAFK